MKVETIMAFLGFFDSYSGKWISKNVSKLIIFLLLLFIAVQILVGDKSSSPELSSRIFDAKNLTERSPADAARWICNGSTASNTTKVMTTPNATVQKPPPNSSFLTDDTDRWSNCDRYMYDGNRSFSQWITRNAEDREVLCAAHRVSKSPIAQGTPRIAFMFMVRGWLGLEPVWRKFFEGHEDRYSIYVHATDPDVKYSHNSLFHGRTIPSRPLERFQISYPDTIRRLLAYSLLDSTVPNAWFSLVCETTVPVRAFPYTYEYLINSQLSFVESFYSNAGWFRMGWKTVSKEESVPDALMRKGECWITVHRRHAGLIVGDNSVYPKFRRNWRDKGLTAEVYIPTMFAVEDMYGIANHTVMYVNWTIAESDHPKLYDHTSLSLDVFRGIQNQTSNCDGFYYTGRTWGPQYANEEPCVYNGVQGNPCFLFARKFRGWPEDLKLLLDLVPVIDE